MRHNEYLQRKRELDERLRSGIELLESAHRAEVRALETLWASYGEEEGFAPPLIPPHRPAVHRPGRDLYDEVVEGLDRVPHEFGAREVCLALGRELHRASLHRVLLKLVHEGVVEVKDAGSGRRATVYGKVRPAPGDAHSS